MIFIFKRYTFVRGKESRQFCQNAKTMLAFIRISSIVTTTVYVIHTEYMNKIKSDRELKLCLRL